MYLALSSSRVRDSSPVRVRSMTMTSLTSKVTEVVANIWNHSADGVVVEVGVSVVTNYVLTPLDILCWAETQPLAISALTVQSAEGLTLKRTRYL